jgi:hypothetical protein
MKLMSKHIGLIVLVWIVVMANASGQQNRMLYNLHEVPQSSFLNPAVPLPCGWTIGLPVISSVHLNVGDNVVSFNQVFTSLGGNHYETNLYNIEKYLHRRNFINSEVHTELLGLGYRHGAWSYLFSVIEKNNLAGTMPRDIFQLALHGNSIFEGKTAQLNGVGLYMSHYREYALSIAKDNSENGGVSWGIRGKLLFGKLNFSTRKADAKLATDGTRFDLGIDASVEVNSSLPVYLTVEDNEPQDLVRDESQDAQSILMNRKNPGIAVDAGIIVPLSDELRFSASLIDVGMIKWASNLHNYKVSGRFRYSGPINNNQDTDVYLDDLEEAFHDSIHLTTNSNSYNTWLAPKLLAGLHYTPSGIFSFSGSADLQRWRTKWVTGVSASAAIEPLEHVKLLVSLSHQYFTGRQIGAGLVLGYHPIQFYAVSDNIAGFIWPLSARNINLRFGINILPGCMKREKSKKVRAPGKPNISALEGTCGWIKDDSRRRRH